MEELYQTDTHNEQVNPDKGIQVCLSEQNLSFLPCTTSVVQFSEETLTSISKLGDVLRRIDRRMKNEGYCIKNGKIVRDENI